MPISLTTHRSASPAFLTFVCFAPRPIHLKIKSRYDIDRKFPRKDNNPSCPCPFIIIHIRTVPFRREALRVQEVWNVLRGQEEHGRTRVPRAPEAEADDLSVAWLRRQVLAEGPIPRALQALPQPHPRARLD
uniref:Autophagy-related protein n=1 Tax=Steinernema glaseri TaxID=37863 RepID=A0A1I7Y473_9BILA